MKAGIDVPRLGQRLQEARKRAGLKQQVVAERLGIARTTIVAIEKGERGVKADELVSLAALYGASVSDLQRPMDPLPRVPLQFRGRIDEAGRVQLEAICHSLAEDYVFLESLRSAPLPRQLPPEISMGADPARSARIAAEDERRRLGLGLEPVLSVRTLLEERSGIRVFQFELPGASSVAAVYFYQEPAGAVVCVNGAQGWRRRRLSLSHELGHVIGSRHHADVLDLEAASTIRRPHEVFSDAFQRHFLMPSGALERFVIARKRERGGAFVPNDIVELADIFGVSFEAICRALEEDALVKAGTFDYLMARGFKPEYSQRSESVFALDVDRSPVSARFQRLAAAAFLRQELSEGALAKLLRVDRIEARAIVRNERAAIGVEA